MSNVSQDESYHEKLEITRDFIAESRELLEGLDNDLMSIEKDIESSGKPTSELVHGVFRAMHSIKGAAGFLKFQSISSLTHHAESLLDLFRKEKGEFKSNHIDLFYQASDLIKEQLSQVEIELTDTGKDAEAGTLIADLQIAFENAAKPTLTAEDYTACLKQIDDAVSKALTWFQDPNHLTDQTQTGLIFDLLDQISRNLDMLKQDDLNRLCGMAAKTTANYFHKRERSHPKLVDFIVVLLKKIASKLADAGSSQATLHVSDADLDEVAAALDGAEAGSLLGETLVELGLLSDTQLTNALERQNLPLGELLLESKAVDKPELQLGLKVQKRQKSTDKPNLATQSIRVDLTKLDLLGNLVGELVISQNMVTHHEQVSGDGFESFHKSAAMLKRISRELQDLVMTLRMVPVHATFQKLNRVIRDVSHKLGKHVEVREHGSDTEIDKNVVEKLSSPLVHVVRNAVDHGIEMPAERLAAGKDQAGVIHLEARQEGGEILIIISDNGKGLDKNAIRKKAIERGLIDTNHHFANDKELFGLIFEPGFSTAGQVTEVSGRGVGMDVVRSNIESLNGSIEVSSVPGEGSTFLLRIPLTLSIIDGMLVRVGATVFTIPLLSIRESIRATGLAIVKAVDGGEHVKIRNKMIPILRMNRYFDIPGDTHNLTQGILVVVYYGSESLALFVDEIMGQRQTVIKRASDFLGRVHGVSGFSILNSGDITLIMDVAGIIRGK